MADDSRDVKLYLILKLSFEGIFRLKMRAQRPDSQDNLVLNVHSVPRINDNQLASPGLIRCGLYTK